MPAPRRNVRSTPDGGSAVQPPGLSYTAHWEALGCALCLLTTPEISSTGPVRGRGFCPGSHRPRARVPLVVWAWDFLLCGFLAAVSQPLLAHCFSLCDLRLFVIKRMFLSFIPARGRDGLGAMARTRGPHSDIASGGRVPAGLRTGRGAPHAGAYVHWCPRQASARGVELGL